MSRSPAIAEDRRQIALLALVALALGEPSPCGLRAFATRAVIGALREGTGDIPVDDLIAIAVAGLVIFNWRTAEGAVGERPGSSYAAAIRRRLFMHITRMPLSAMAERRASAAPLRFVGDLTAFEVEVPRGAAHLISARAPSRRPASSPICWNPPSRAPRHRPSAS